MKFIDELGITHHIKQFKPSVALEQSSAIMVCNKILNPPFLAHEKAEKEHVEFCEKCQEKTGKEEW